MKYNPESSLEGTLQIPFTYHWKLVWVDMGRPEVKRRRDVFTFWTCLSLGMEKI